MTDEQYEFFKKQANILAKILMDLEIEHIFGKNGNSNFVLETIVILTAGTVSILSEHIGIDAILILNAFHKQTIHTLKANEKKPFLTLIN